MTINKAKQYRPPVSAKRRAMLERMAKKLNDDGALIPLTPHNMLDASIDRAYMIMFPDDKNLPKRKRISIFEF
jgi:hypothetical protein